MYEIRSVRAVLPAGAAHFHRLVRCTKCDREVPGPPLVTPADLDQPAHPVFCDRCARSPAAAREVPRKKEAPRAPVAQPRSPPVVGDKPSEDVSVDRRRLAAVEARLAEVLSRLPSPVDEDDLLRRLSNQVAGAMREQNAELGRISASVSEVRAEVGALAEGLDRQRAEIAALEERIGDESAAVTALLEAGASRLHALEQKIHASVQRLIHPVEGRPPGALLESLEQQLREAEERLTQR